jgi:hypothetical protein
VDIVVFVNDRLGSNFEKASVKVSLSHELRLSDLVCRLPESEPRRPAVVDRTTIPTRTVKDEG